MNEMFQIPVLMIRVSFNLFADYRHITLRWSVNFIIVAISLLLSSGCTNPDKVSGKQYYISVDGNDSDKGTAEKPWRTLEKANQILQPGDVVILRDGTYDGIISPANNGENDKKPIIYRSENRHGAVLTGKADSRYIINLKDKQYITIDGLKMLPSVGGFGYIIGCDHIVLQYCHMEHSSRVYCPLEFIDSDYNRMLFNNMTRVIQRTVDSRIHGDGCHFINSSYNVIEGNSFSKIGHSPLRIWSKVPHKANFNIVRGNCFHNGWGRNFEMFNLDRSLFEKNVITDAFNGTMSADAMGKMFFTDGIIRHNLVYDNWDVPLASGSYIDKPTTGDVPLELNNSRIYNNTFVNNPSSVWGFGGRTEPAPIRSNIFMNNLFSYNDFEGNFIALTFRADGTENNLFHNNLLYGAGQGQASIRYHDRRYTADELNRDLPELSKDNIDADPQFKSFEDRFFMPGDNSPVRNAGRVLTRTSGSGRGKNLQVLDARGFYDGFGIEGEKGDIIVIGSKKSMARVIKSDIEKNILTLDRSVKWDSGDPVSLPYVGEMPDIGAFQTGSTGILQIVPFAKPVVAGPGQNITFSALVSGAKGDAKMEWDLGDGTITSEKSPVHKYGDYGDYILRLSCRDKSGTTVRSIFFVRIEKTVDPKAPLMQMGFEEEDFEEWGHLWDRGPNRGDRHFYPEMRDDGKGMSMCVTAEGGNVTLATNVKMKVWDIDKYPYVKFSYRIPKGVPVGVWLNPWPSENRPERICVGGSAGNSSGRFVNLNEYKLTDDGKWHDITIDARVVRKSVPDLKYLHIFDFSTYGKTKPDQKFWFDDFEILP